MIRFLMRGLRLSQTMGLRGIVLIFASGCHDSGSGPLSSEPRQLWTVGDAAGARSTPFADADLAAYTKGFASGIVAVEANSGSVRWSRTFADGPAGLPLPFANILGDGSALFVPAWNLYALACSNGATRWVFTSPDEYAAGSTLLGRIALLSRPARYDGSLQYMPPPR